MIEHIEQSDKLCQVYSNRVREDGPSGAGAPAEMSVQHRSETD